MIDRQKRDVLMRLKAVCEHLDAVIAMVEREGHCPEVMKQVGAVQAFLSRRTMQA